MFNKLISKIFPESKEKQAYIQMCEILREILIPLNFTESQMDIPESLSKQCVFQRGEHKITFYYDMRERAYALLTPSNKQSPIQDGDIPQAQNLVIFSLSFPEYNEAMKSSLQDAMQQWLKSVN